MLVFDKGVNKKTLMTKHRFKAFMLVRQRVNDEILTLDVDLCVLLACFDKELMEKH